MADPIPLKFQPRWDRIGDADKTGFAILYGIIAMTTVWLFENLVENLLFPSNMTISISDAAALLTFQGASWVDIVKWNSKSHRGNRRNRRAYIAVLLRLAITLVDVFIVFLSIPQEMKVLESDVGRPELNLSNLSKKGNKLLNDTNFSELSVCTWYVRASSLPCPYSF